MANGHGGYRRPSKPAAVSGPGALSRRTDGKQPVMDLPDAAYGEAKTFREQQQSAPMAQAAQPTQSPGIDLSGVVPLTEPTQQPDVPVTDGAAYGPGAGTAAIGVMANPQREDAQWLAKYLPVLIDISQRDSTAPSTKRFIRTIIANL